MIKGIDHIVILVKDLDQASADYTALGFTVVPGGEHTGGATHNALIAFADDSYLELIAFKKSAPDHRWWPQVAAKGEGLIDFALLPTDIANDIAAARTRGVAYEGPVPGGRLRPDGQEVKWQMGLPPEPALPFLCGDVTPRHLRVPSGKAWQHPNGVTGIHTLVIQTTRVADCALAYSALLGLRPEVSQDYGTPSFKTGNAEIVLHLGEGNGPLLLVLSAPDDLNFNPALTHNVRLSAV